MRNKIIAAFIIGISVSAFSFNRLTKEEAAFNRGYMWGQIDYSKGEIHAHYIPVNDGEDTVWHMDTTFHMSTAGD